MKNYFAGTDKLFFLIIFCCSLHAFSQQRVIDRSYFSGYAFMEITDLNNDGRNDFVGWSDDTYLSWYEQVAGGTGFTPHYIGDTTSFFPSDGLICADMNTDGRMDIIGSADYSLIRIMMQDDNDEVTFTPHELDRDLHDGDSHVNEFDLADIDSDGDLDILISFYGTSDKLAWYENNGADAFTFPYHDILCPDIGSPENIKAEDFDNDGDPDFFAYDFFDEKLFYYKNNGDGNFTEINLLTETFIDDIETADMNNDGFEDIVYSQDGSFMDENGYITLLKNNGDGTFTSKLLSDSGFASIFISDLNEDGRPDIFSTIYYYQNLNDAVTLDNPVPFLSLLPEIPEIGIFFLQEDINSDGIRDIELFVDKNIVLFPRNEDLSFEDPDLLVSMWDDILSSSSANMNNDGVDDIVVFDKYLRINWYQFNAVSDSFSMVHRIERLGRNANYFTRKGVMVFDADMDGDDDIITSVYGVDEYENTVLDDYTTYYYENNGTGEFNNRMQLDFYFLKAISSDIDGNGFKDLVTYASGGLEPEIHIIKNFGFAAGDFSNANISSRYISDFTFFDFDMDGDEDIICTGFNDDAVIAMELEEGNATGTEITIAVLADAYSSNPIFFDDDNDGDKDLFNISEGFSGISLFKSENNGDNTFLLPVLISSFYPMFSNHNYHLFTKDINNDGLDDIIFSGGSLNFVKNTPAGMVLSPSYIISYVSGDIISIYNDAIPEFMCWDARTLYWGSEINDDIIATSIYVDENASQLLVYPNPAHNIITLSLSELETNISKVCIYDLWGRSVWEQPISINGQYSFNTTSFVPGIYFISVTANGQCHTASFVKQ